jgi:polyferredoxin
VLNIVRPRTMIYAGLLAIVTCIVLYFSLNRTMLGLNAVADRNPLYVALSDGSVRNTFTLRVLNKKYAARTFKISAEGIEGVQVTMLDGENKAEPKVLAAPDDVGVARVAVTLPPAALAKLPPDEIVPFTFRIEDTTDGSIMTRPVTFRKPR